MSLFLYSFGDIILFSMIITRYTRDTLYLRRTYDLTDLSKWELPSELENAAAAYSPYPAVIRPILRARPSQPALEFQAVEIWMMSLEMMKHGAAQRRGARWKGSVNCRLFPAVTPLSMHPTSGAITSIPRLWECDVPGEEVKVLAGNLKVWLHPHLYLILLKTAHQSHPASCRPTVLLLLASQH